MRNYFDEQLDMLNRELIQMGALCEEIIALSGKALTEDDKTLIQNVPSLATQIDQKERNIETSCLKLLLHQQPVASDLRLITAALKMINDMERIGRISENISEIIQYLLSDDFQKSPMVHDMAKNVLVMVSNAASSFVNRDIAMAKEVINMDDSVDDYFVKLKGQLVTLISQNPLKSEYGIDLLMIIKYFEKIGDHAVSIAKWVIFAIDGER